MIINIRGTSGSGKSTLVRLLMEHEGVDPVSPGAHEVKDSNGDRAGYCLPKSNTFIVGSYHNQCGGCDGIELQDVICNLVHWGAANYRNVIFEGAIVSTIWGRYSAMASKYKPNFTFLFMDTPIDVCNKRILERRAAAGNFKPLDMENTEKKYASVKRCFIKCVKDGHPGIWVPHENPLPILVEVLQ